MIGNAGESVPPPEPTRGAAADSPPEIRGRVPRVRLLDASGLPILQPLTEPAQAALRAVLARHGDELNAALAPFGFAAADVAVPTFERVTFADEYLIDREAPS